MEYFIIISIGYYLNEKIHEVTANILGYDSYYLASYGKLSFFNKKINDEMINLRRKIDGDHKPISPALKNSNEWKKLESKDLINHTLIRLSGITFLLIISIIGYFLWVRQKNKSESIKWFHYSYLILSLFFLRETLLSVLAVINGYQLCDDIKIWRLFGVNWIYFDPVIILTSLFILLFILFKQVPKNIRFNFIISGIIGATVSFILIIKFIGPFLL